MTDETKDITPAQSAAPAEGLSEDELEAQQGEQLPDREQMSVINSNLQPLPPVE
jgi:hypothetical protein